MKIHISSDCKKYLDDLGGWIIERRGIIDVKVTLLQQQQPVHNTASSPQFTDIRYVARPLSCSVFFSPDDLNPFEIRGNYSATWNNMKVVHWPLMSGLLHLVQRGWDWAGPQLASPLITVPNVTAHPSTASVPITVLLYNGPLLCGFNVTIKGLIGILALPRS